MKICRSNEKKQTIRFDTDPDRTVRVKKTKKKAAFLSVALSGAMIISLFSAVFVVKPEKAAAAESLPGIEQIKTNLNKGVQALKILEITDGEKYSASFGYSIEGQEPIDLENDVLKEAVKEENETGRLARYNAGNDYFWDLVNKGIINSNVSTPLLSFTKEFMEYYPWDYANYEGLKELSLAAAETVSVRGSYKSVENKKGSFSPAGNSYAVDPERGTYAQDLETYNGSFITGQNVEYSNKNEYIFYTPVFQQFYVDADEEGKALFYRELDEDGEPDKNTEFSINDSFKGKYVLTSTKNEDDEIVSYDYYGTFGSLNRWERRTERDKDGKRVLKPYYYLDSLMGEGEVPVIGFEINNEASFNKIAEDDKWFALSITGVMPISLDNSYKYTRYFTFDPKGFSYVGAGNGDYDISVTSVENDNKYKAYKNDSGDTKFDVTYDKEYYYCDVKNNNLFLKYVLDYDLDSTDEELSRAAAGIEVDVVKYTDVLYGENEVDFSAYDLIVLQPGEGHFVFADDSEANSFVNKLQNPALAGTAIIFAADRGDYGYGSDWLLTQKVPSTFSSKKYSKEDHADGDAGNSSSIKGANTFIIKNHAWTPNSGFEKGYVDGNLLFYNIDKYDTYKNENGEDVAVRKRVVFLDNDLSTSIDAKYYKNAGSAFDGVYSEIQYENFLRQREGKTELLDASNIHLGTLIRYILNYKNRRGATDKETIRILEIEPDNHSQLNTDGSAFPEGQSGKASNEVLSWFGGKKPAESINISTMSTYEFVGKIEEVTSNYDLVYIGSDVEVFHKDDNVTKFNDPEMEGLVYFNIGDIVTNTHGTFAGLLKEDIDAFNSTNENGRLDYKRKYRFSGNDITEKKYKELKKFADTGFPVIFANDLLIKNGTNSSENEIKKVDVNSRLYTLMDEIKGYDNVYNSASASLQYESMKKYLSLSKPSIEFEADGRPEDYVDLNNRHPIGNDNMLKFRFHISNPTDTSPEKTTYGAYLYLDQDGNGLFTESELLSDFVIRDSSGKEVNGSSLKGGSSNVYTASRIIDTKSGILPWKLVVRETGTGKDYPAEAYQKGWAYKTPDEAIPIKVLQIGSNRKNTNIANAFKEYLDEIRSIYNITVTYYNANEINKYYDDNNRSEDDARNILSSKNDYDMVLLGFDDSFIELSKTTAEKVRDFANLGKAVLTTHDTTSFVNYEGWGFIEHYKANPSKYLQKGTGTKDTIFGYYINSIIRGRIEMDRYGITNTSDLPVSQGNSTYNIHLGGDGGVLYNGSEPSDMTDGVKDAIKKAGYDVAYQPTANQSKKGIVVPETQGFTDFALQTNHPRFSDNKYNYKYKYSMSEGLETTKKVSQANEGQITKFPYNIEGKLDNTNRSVLDVDTTHYQYYQLNLNSEDIVVWYNLYGDGNNVYRRMPNDAVNSYYIYSVGNITYTGAGHTGVTGVDSEKKLFVNTIVAAYRNANAKPVVNFVSGTGDNSVGIETLYLPKEKVSSFITADGGSGGQDVEYDTEGPGAAGGKITFRFTDNNMSTKKLFLKDMKIDFGKSFVDTIDDEWQKKKAEVEFKDYYFKINDDGNVIVRYRQNPNDADYTESWPQPTDEKITFIDEDGNAVKNGEFVSGKTYSIDIGELARIFNKTAMTYISANQYKCPVHLPSDFSFVVTPVSEIGGVPITGDQVTLPIKTLDMFDIG